MYMFLSMFLNMFLFFLFLNTFLHMLYMFLYMFHLYMFPSLLHIFLFLVYKMFLCSHLAKTLKLCPLRRQSDTSVYKQSNLSGQSECASIDL